MDNSLFDQAGSTQPVTSGATSSTTTTVKPWGRLVSCHPHSKSIDLVADESLFGRNHKRCQFILIDPTVSGIHCKIFRMTPQNQQQQHNLRSSNDNSINHDNSNNNSAINSGSHTIWVTDYSTNGTFVKGVILGKEKTTILQNGDMISFTSSKINSTLSFIFQDLLLSAQDLDDEEIKKHYILQGILGTGNFSVVKKCTKKDTGESFAVKIIDKKKYWHLSNTRNQTESEINILKQIKHPNIISIMEIFDTERYLYIVLELATGGELFDKIRQKGRFNEPEAKDVFKQILNAVSYLHHLNISHRDLKPENILFGNQSNDSLIKITDFGLAKIIGEKEIATTLCGTPLYVAPEIIKSCLNTDEKKENMGYGKEVDAWSLGCILYILLSGRPPFDVDNAAVGFKQINEGNYSFDFVAWRGVSEQAKDLITKLLNVDPHKRITPKEALNHPWFSDEIYRSNTTINQSPVKQQPIIHLPNIKSQNSAISLNLSFPKSHESKTSSSNSSNNSSSNSSSSSSIGSKGKLQFQTPTKPSGRHLKPVSPAKTVVKKPKSSIFSEPINISDNEDIEEPIEDSKKRKDSSPHQKSPTSATPTTSSSKNSVSKKLKS